ncbi:MAG: hypothetical protein SPK03_02100 [Alloprevotella sp.]|nr:hypothetical protein [Alloprevotella sp.]
MALGFCPSHLHAISCLRTFTIRNLFPEKCFNLSASSWKLVKISGKGAEGFDFSTLHNRSAMGAQGAPGAAFACALLSRMKHAEGFDFSTLHNPSAMGAQGVPGAAFACDLLLRLKHTERFENQTLQPLFP